MGGRTIAEAKQTISFNEFKSWVAYRAKRGSFNAGLMIELSIAQLAVMYANSHSKNGGFKLYDFAPHHDESIVTLDQAMKEWV